MKRQALILGVILFFGLTFQLKAQDTIRLKNGAIQLASVMEVGDEAIVFKKWKAGDKDGTQQAPLSNVLSVRYQSGYEEVFQQQDVAIKTDVITLVNALSMEGRILEVDDKVITVRLSSFTTDSIRRLSVDSIAKIQYANGFTERYNDIVLKTISGSTVRAGKDAIAKPDTVRMVNGKVLTGMVSEIEEDVVVFASFDRDAADLMKLQKSTIQRIDYANGYTEQYSTIALSKEKELNDPSSSPEAQLGKTAGKPKKQKDPAPGKPAVLFSTYSLEDIEALPATTRLQNSSDGNHIKKLNLSGKTLSTLDPWIFSLDKMVALDISNNGLKEVPERLLQMPHLQYLKADNLPIRKFPSAPDYLDSIGMAYLVVRKGKISALDGSLFLLPNLQFIDFSFNEIRSVGNPGKKEVLPAALAYMDLSNNRIKDIPRVVPRLSALQYLDISNNQVKDVDFSSFTTINLELLNLSGNPIKELPDNLYNLRSLTTLNLSGTLVAKLSDSIAKLTELASLHLPDKLQAFPASLKNHQRLKELSMRQNAVITRFPETIATFSRLEALDLSGTKISTLPASIGNLKRLKTVDLSNCGLSAVPSALFELPRLQRIDLSGNKITSLPTSLGSLDQLEYMNLENSPVRHESLLRLKKALPLAFIKYYSTELGLNYESKPVSPEFQSEFIQLLSECERGNTSACYELGQFFEKRNDYGLALKVYYRIAEELSSKGSAQWALAYYKVAELFDDANNSKSYNSIYKRRNYNSYDDYRSNTGNNKALIIYCKICEENPADENALATTKKPVQKLHWYTTNCRRT